MVFLWFEMPKIMTAIVGPARGGEDDLTYSCGSVPPKKLQIKSKNRTGLFGFGLVD